MNFKPPHTIICYLLFKVLMILFKFKYSSLIIRSKRQNLLYRYLQSMNKDLLTVEKYLRRICLATLMWSQCLDTANTATRLCDGSTDTLSTSLLVQLFNSSGNRLRPESSVTISLDPSRASPKPASSGINFFPATKLNMS